MKINQAYKFKLKTNYNIESKIDFYLGCSRFVWNKSLALIKARLENRNIEKVIQKNIITKYKKPEYLPNYNELSAMLTFWKKTDDCYFLNKAPSQAIQQTLKDLFEAVGQAFTKGSGKRFPVFKKKGRTETGLRFPQGFKIDNNRVFLPKLGWIGFFKSRDIDGKVKSITVKKLADGYYISVLIEKELEKGKWSDIMDINKFNPVGIDVGIKKIVTLSNGIYFKSLDLSKIDAKIYKEQTKLSLKLHSRKKGDKVKKSKNYIKQSKKVALLNKKKADIKYDYLHKVSSAIAKNHGLIAIENLKVCNMTKSAKGTVKNPGSKVKAKSGLNRSILNQSWSMFYGMLEYKLLLNGGKLIKVNPARTSQECPLCHYTHKDNRQTQENFICKSCGFSINADLVASVNVINKALPDYNFNLPQDLRELTPVEYLSLYRGLNEADKETYRQ
jgi:putative transposase